MSEATTAQDYYDAFSNNYERHRHRGYHRLIDELEVSVAQAHCRGTVLEAGCGTGLILQRLQHAVGHPVGVDLSAGMLRKARQRELSIAQASVNALPFADNSLDGVISFKVLAHVPDIRGALREFARVTKPGGRMVLEFYNRNSLRYLVKRLKRPTQTGAAYHDEDMYTRYDCLSHIRGYLPSGLSLLDIRGVRVLTPLAQLHDLPLIGPLLAACEHGATHSRLLGRWGGFLIVVLKKEQYDKPGR